jgi:hypothetical protein
VEEVVEVEAEAAAAAAEVEVGVEVVGVGALLHFQQRRVVQFGLGTFDDV